MELHPEHYIPGRASVSFVVTFQLRRDVRSVQRLAHFPCTVRKTYQDVPLQQKARFNGDADTGVAVSLHVARSITMRKCLRRLTTLTRTENTESQYNNSIRTRSPTCRPAASLGRSSGKDGSLCDKDSLFTSPAILMLFKPSDSYSPPLDSKLGIPCMITW